MVKGLSKQQDCFGTAYFFYGILLCKVFSLNLRIAEICREYRNLGDDGELYCFRASGGNLQLLYNTAERPEILTSEVDTKYNGFSTTIMRRV